MNLRRNKSWIPSLSLLTAAAAVGVSLWLQAPTAEAQAQPVGQGTASTPVWGNATDSTENAGLHNPVSTGPAVGHASLPAFGPAPKPTAAANGPAVLPAFARGNPQETMTYYIKQIAVNRTPTLEDYQRLSTLPEAKDVKFPMPFGSGHFIMAMCLDLQNNLWVGTEGEGLFRFSPADGMWTQYVAGRDPPPDGNLPIPDSAVECGMGDNYVYALACDHQGRVWIGHLNHGISVFNGEKFQSYEVVGGLSRLDSLNGPLGERVFHIALAPEFTDQNAGAVPTFHDQWTGKDSSMSKSVWICTSAGLSAYFPSTDTWSYVTVADGLPSDQANSLTFGPDGTVYVATQCDGIAISSPSNHYQSWKQVARRVSSLESPHAATLPMFNQPESGLAVVPSLSGTSSNVILDDPLTDNPPTTPIGKGLPSNLINDVLVAHSGAIYAATTTGLAWSSDSGNTWQFVRGLDYAEKVRLSWSGPPPGWAKQPGVLLSEDYCTTLAEDSVGNILVGHRTKPGDVIAPMAARIVSALPTGYTNVYVDAGGLFCRGMYGGGVAVNSNTQLAIGSKLGSAPNTLASNSILAMQRTLPSGAWAASNNKSGTVHVHLEERRAQLPHDYSPVSLLTPDWTTQGSWIGRIGRYWMAHAAAISPHDLYWGVEADRVEYRVQQGSPGTEPNDSLRYWVSANYTNDIRALELVTPYLHSRVEKGLTTWEVDRRQGEWDDHGEVTAASRQGPGVYISIRVPSGAFSLSLYSNYGYGRTYNEPNRDYLLSIREPPNGTSFADIKSFFSWPELARARVFRHYGGVYSRFHIDGPREIAIYVDRNWSFNANLMGAFLDEENPFPGKYFGELASRWKPPSVRDRRAQVFLVRSILSTLDPKVESQELIAALWSIGFYSQAEQLLQANGFRSSRQIEKALRWNRSISGISGKLNSLLIEQYLANQHNQESERK